MMIPVVDYSETFAHTARLVSVRILIQQCIVHYDLQVHQKHVKCVYLNADTDIDSFMVQTKGFEEGEIKPVSLEIFYMV